MGRYEGLCEICRHMFPCRCAETIEDIDRWCDLELGSKALEIEYILRTHTAKMMLEEYDRRIPRHLTFPTSSPN